jgi:hypothetical protein
MDGERLGGKEFGGSCAKDLLEDQVVEGLSDLGVLADVSVCAVHEWTREQTSGMCACKRAWQCSI